MNRTVVLSAATFFLLCLSHGISRAASFAAETPGTAREYHNDAGSDPFKAMAQELSESAELLTNPKIAVMPFSYGKEKKSDVGTIVSERLTTRIVKLRKLKVIERQMLDNVLQELHFEETGIVNAETTKKLGQVLGVEAIITGTVIDLDDDTAEINARVIKTDTAEVIATSSVDIPITWEDGAAPARSEPAQESEPVEKPRSK